MSYPLEHRFAGGTRQDCYQSKDSLMAFARYSLAEVMEAIDQQVACDQWVESHLARQGVTAPTPKQIDMAQIRLVEMLAISLAFEHPDFPRVMEFVQRCEAELFVDLPEGGLGFLPYQSNALIPAYLGKPLFYFVEGLCEELGTTGSPFNQRPSIRNEDGSLRDVSLYCRYHGPQWEGSLDYLAQKNEMDLIAALHNANLLDHREVMQALLTCSRAHLPDLRFTVTGSYELGNEEASHRFREMLRVAAAPSTHTRLPAEHSVAFIDEQLNLLWSSSYQQNQWIFDFYAVMGETDKNKGVFRLDNQKLLENTFRTLMQMSPDFYRHLAISLMGVPAGQALSTSFNRTAFSDIANRAFLRALTGNAYGVSSDFDIKKAMVMQVGEDDFHFNGYTSRERRELYKLTGFQPLLEEMSSTDLTDSMEADLCL
ncbi:hypothetical protein DV532_26625 (plasmid) [Pseudomonas sp. Leaf58]|uniref:hypothetical protein n=1 Tax=Pseudomonas sp. Leaf58 TaxID=1736226 RepID=UPI0006FE08FB|nr:hypothetical protein [Pseudomonas sp. Leaf58]AYG47862.1 hypothetical protein DV532_26625 [Pseudomonas sp. Leaf58]KQN62573.1 hypothetical protein ASF02_10530 [Pseudomonas sp. Leaf58]